MNTRTGMTKILDSIRCMACSPEKKKKKKKLKCLFFRRPYRPYPSVEAVSAVPPLMPNVSMFTKHRAKLGLIFLRAVVEFKKKKKKRFI